MKFLGSIRSPQPSFTEWVDTKAEEAAAEVARSISAGVPSPHSVQIGRTLRRHDVMPSIEHVGQATLAKLGSHGVSEHVTLDAEASWVASTNRTEIEPGVPIFSEKRNGVVLVFDRPVRSES